MNKWQDWVNFVLGLWVIVSPWTIEHVMAPGGVVTEAAMWNHYVIGTLVVILAVAAIYAFNAWMEWANIVAGGWLAISPWVLGYSESLGLMWNALVAGVLIIAFAGWALGEDQVSGQLSKSKRS
jgi:SPW repeat-containing protein